MKFGKIEIVAQEDIAAFDSNTGGARIDLVLEIGSDHFEMKFDGELKPLDFGREFPALPMSVHADSTINAEYEGEQAAFDADKAALIEYLTRELNKLAEEDAA